MGTLSQNAFMPIKSFLGKQIFANIKTEGRIKRRFRPILMLALLLPLYLTACTKEEGEGGTSSVTGKVLVLDYNDTFTALLGTYYGMDREVFIVYGDHIVYDDKTTTFYDGTYRFENLRQGQYSVYAYSEDSTGQVAPNEFPVIQTFEITYNKQNIIVPDLIIVR